MMLCMFSYPTVFQSVLYTEDDIRVVCSSNSRDHNQAVFDTQIHDRNKDSKGIKL